MPAAPEETALPTATREVVAEAPQARTGLVETAPQMRGVKGITVTAGWQALQEQIMQTSEVVELGQVTAPREPLAVIRAAAVVAAKEEGLTEEVVNVR